MAKRKPEKAEKKVNVPLSFRLPDDVWDALEGFRNKIAERSGFDPPARAKVIIRALRDYLAANGFPTGGDDD